MVVPRLDLCPRISPRCGGEKTSCVRVVCGGFRDFVGWGFLGVVSFGSWVPALEVEEFVLGLYGRDYVTRGPPKVGFFVSGLSFPSSVCVTASPRELRTRLLPLHPEYTPHHIIVQRGRLYGKNHVHGTKSFPDVAVQCTVTGRNSASHCSTLAHAFARPVPAQQAAFLCNPRESV